MSKVYVINQSSHDYSSAEQFGTLVFMTKGTINRFQTSEIYRLFEPFLDYSQPGDYLLMGGHTVMVGVACGMFAQLHGRLNLLIYKSTEKGIGNYKKRSIVFNFN